MQKTGLDDWLWPPLKQTAQLFFQHRTFFVLCCFCFWGGVHDCRCVCVKEFKIREGLKLKLDYYSSGGGFHI